jgi:hypothetical protein
MAIIDELGILRFGQGEGQASPAHGNLFMLPVSSSLSNFRNDFSQAAQTCA